MPVDQAALDSVALSLPEYELLVEQLGREPNVVELGMFGSLWSEHCGYKNSKPLLKLFPSGGDLVLTKAGAENAGAIDIGGGLCVVMKVESHNHPSAIEPYEGAATGVGGIVRDIFAMGAYPVAILNSLRFGPPNVPQNRFLFEGVVGGIGGYGNCLGIPNVGGEVVFSESYSGNPLVNAMCVGIAETSKLQSAKARGEGMKAKVVLPDLPPDAVSADEALRAWRRERCRADDVPAYIVASNAVLASIAISRPTTLADLAKLDGIGPTKLDLYGDEILAVLEALE